MTEVIRIGGVPEHFNSPCRLALEANAFEAQEAIESLPPSLDELWHPL